MFFGEGVGLRARRHGFFGYLLGTEAHWVTFGYLDVTLTNLHHRIVVGIQ